MRLSVRLFAGLRESVGQDRVSVELPEGARVSDLVERLAHEHATLARHRGRFAVAVNLAVAAPGDSLRATDEVALLPPVGGGAPEEDPDALCFLTPGPIDVARCLAFVTHPGAGGISLFLGTARDVNEGSAVASLAYEAYEPMALASLHALVKATRAHVPALKRIALAHRLGPVPLTEAAVLVAVSTPHRAEAFLACRYAIDELKAHAPIWKKEALASGGARWVENAPPPGSSPA